MEAFTASVDFDRRLYRYDIQGSIAHATMLARQGILTEAERDAIITGLEQIRAHIEAGEFAWSVALEDVHMNIESALTEAIGDAGKKLHTGRSRNDQVATDIRLWLRSEIETLGEAILRLQTALLEKAEQWLQGWQRLTRRVNAVLHEELRLLSPEQVNQLQRPMRTRQMLSRFCHQRDIGRYDVVITGHTHQAGCFNGWYFNCGCGRDRQTAF